MDKNHLKKYMVQVEGLELKGSGVLFNYFDEVYIFTAKHNLQYKDKQKIKNIDILELLKQKSDIKIYPHENLKVEDILELDKDLDLLILKIDKSSMDGIEIDSLSIFEEDLNDSLLYTIVGYPQIRNNKSIEFFDCTYEVSDNLTFEVHSDKVNALSEKRKNKDLVGLSGGGAFVESNGQIYLLGIQIRYEGFSNLECINLQKIKDKIDEKLLKSKKNNTIKEVITLKNGKLFTLEFIKVELEDKILYVGKYPVTFEEYDLFCDDIGKDKPNDKNWGRGKLPLINVSLEDAKKYCEWLNLNSHLSKLKKIKFSSIQNHYNYFCKKSNIRKEFILPKIDDWEIIAKKNKKEENIWYKQRKTIDVTLKGEGRLGIFHMYGNVLEWCSDKDKDNNYIALGGSYRKHSEKKFRAKLKHSFASEEIGVRIFLKRSLE